MILRTFYTLFVFSLSYAGVWLAPENNVKMLQLGSYDERSPCQDALDIQQITAAWKCTLTIIFLRQHIVRLKLLIAGYIYFSTFSIVHCCVCKHSNHHKLWLNRFIHGSRDSLLQVIKITAK